MKKVIVVILSIVFINFFSLSLEHELGANFEINTGNYCSMPVPTQFMVSLGLNYNVKFNSKFSLENNLSLGYYYMTGFLFIYDEAGLLINYSLYPLFHFGPERVTFFISPPGFKIKIIPLLYYIGGPMPSDFEWGYRYFSNIMPGLSSKLGLDIYLGKKKRIILNVFYVNIDFLFYIPRYIINFEYDYYIRYCWYQIGGGTGIRFKVGK